MAPMLWALGGAFVGATAAVLLTPKTGAQLRSDMLSLFGSKDESLDGDLERMENEGGVSHSVKAPLVARDDLRSQS